ncbi:hypothetical protein DBR32_13705 [Taibaiella sp. KBW10]|uniref:hypothetical protein n=1 Tax=Taibaiella sp. KBW10 TaxID=2153357 RepID=UPI000F597514|nr:hypothetical protein [Taibaiella sp. KBW10]RQO29965.1 hypothetical protein DBR32_13705 [Taibaiella sp. KBW10]
MKGKTLLILFIGIIIGFFISKIWAYYKHYSNLDPAFLPLTYKESDTATDHIKEYRGLKLTNINGTDVYSLPHGELHSINSLLNMYDSMRSVQKVVDNYFPGKETYIGIYPYINKDKRLSVYLIPTIGDRNLIDSLGSPIDTAKIIDYIDLVNRYAKYPEVITKVKSNVFNIGNHFP